MIWSADGKKLFCLGFIITGELLHNDEVFPTFSVNVEVGSTDKA